MNTHLRGLSLLAVAVLANAVHAVPLDGNAPSNGPSFLEANEDYVIRFPDASNIFKTSRTEVTEATATSADGQKTSAGPVTWNITLSVTVFHVVRFGGGSWVLLRHPSNPDDFMRWSAQRRALAILAGSDVDQIRAKPDGLERLKELRKAAGAEIETSETWVNLEHAIAIAAVPNKEDESNASSSTSIKFNRR